MAKDSDLKEDRQQTDSGQESALADRRLGIIVNGATGGLASGQHLRALLVIRAEDGLLLADVDRVLPDPILVGRSAERLKMLAAAKAVARWTTDLDAVLSDGADAVFFDAAATGSRYQVVSRAIKAGKHIYCEKPIAGTLQEALDLGRGLLHPDHHPDDCASSLATSRKR